MAQTRLRRILGLGVLAASWSVLLPAPGFAQAAKRPAAAAVEQTFEQPDAEATRGKLTELLQRYPPSLRGVLALDPSLLSNETYLATYPALASFLNAHPEIARNPEFYVGGPQLPRDHSEQIVDMWQSVLAGVAVFLGFGMAIGVIAWLVRTWIDSRKWSRVYKVHTDVHTKLLDRFTANEDLLAYIQSPAGSKFLESAPINLDAGPRSVGAPLGRILWSGQAGVVLLAAGIGLRIIGGKVVSSDAAQPFEALGILGIALGLGLVISAIISYMISHRLGLIERPSPVVRIERPAVQG